MTEPVITHLDEGDYLITSSAMASPLNLLNSVSKVVYASENFGLWNIKVHEGITFDFISVSTGEYLSVFNSAIETTNVLHHWHIIEKQGGYCIQDSNIRKYLTVLNNEGDLGLVDTCDAGEFSVTRYTISA